MSTRTRSMIGAGILGLALSFSLIGCGGGASAPAEESAPQEEATTEAEATPEATSEPEAAEPELAEGLTPHENDLLTIGMAQGWNVPTDSAEVEHFDYENGESGNNFFLKYEDESIAHSSFCVAVYDNETYDWVDYGLPSESDHARNIEALDPITINGVEFVGYRSLNTSMDGSEFIYFLYRGVVDGHYIEIFGTDDTADGTLFEDQITMTKSIHIK